MSEKILSNSIDDSCADNSELGKKTDYDTTYNPGRLFPIPRAGKRAEMGINPAQLPFYGFDIWNHYEVSWLNSKGKPVVAIAQIVYDAETHNIIESKSLKLYFNSLNQMKIESIDQLENLIMQDLSDCVGGPVHVTLQTFNNTKLIHDLSQFEGECLDELDIECSVYHVEPKFLVASNEIVSETLYSDLLKSNCLVTNQPDWGSVQIAYTGNKIHHEGLLKYLISFRMHNEFHEQCIERIFVDIMTYCAPQKLTVYGRYTRRGGLDINPYRSTEKVLFQDKNLRLVRQ